MGLATIAVWRGGLLVVAVSVRNEELFTRKDVVLLGLRHLTWLASGRLTDETVVVASGFRGLPEPVHVVLDQRLDVDSVAFDEGEHVVTRLHHDSLGLYLFGHRCFLLLGL